jgi:hypothetical protein
MFGRCDKRNIYRANHIPCQRGGYRRSRLAEDDQTLRGWIKEKEELTLAELRVRIAQDLGIKVGTTALWHRLEHLAAFLNAYNFAKRLKTLTGLTPYQLICSCFQKKPHRFKTNPHHHSLGLNSPLRWVRLPARLWDLAVYARRHTFEFLATHVQFSSILRTRSACKLLIQYGP